MRKCREVHELFRVCAGREPEEVSTSIVETTEPLSENRPESASSSSASTEVLSTDVGRMFDEFFQFAQDLEKTLSLSGSLHGEDLPAKPKQHRQGFFNRLFGRKGQSPDGQTIQEGLPIQGGTVDLFRQFATGPAQDV
eukprot:CAMPEP_0202890246 /NCGR_PEP_ID=MMETSP1392-20130828/729_1 /ASSEMBLY_ACC=CAM_ASM_000868 /TAXON_ID=225041 /ORGANISM="Chlamydomonas chlamydogama, Strain SAG 11-48b" /LENGTH=137 /DNA_ID=CAMNT_0049573783 /DNA_START=146 /DNA_END=559 /DNA_ORIENTATION=+